MEKNEKITLKIEDMGTAGEGIGKVDGITFFVKDALVGDEINAVVTKMKKTYGYAKMLDIITPSPFRTEAPCPLHRRCGGCQIQALSYDKQLDFKAEKVKNNLVRIGGFDRDFIDSIYQGIDGMDDPYRYRNKAQFPVGRDKDGRIVAGFYAGRTHSIIPVEDCLIGIPENKEIIDTVLKYMKVCHADPYNEETGKGLVRHILIRYGFTTKELMVCLVINGKKLPREDVLIEQLSGISGMKSISVNINRENTNVILGDETKVIWGQSYITDYIGDIKFRISPVSFFQVNPVQTKKLYDTAIEYADLKGNETLWDMYCGIGTISLYAASKAFHVIGVEIVPQAIEDAKLNARENGIENAEFHVGKAEDVMPELWESRNTKDNIVIVDPPRKGCDEKLLETILNMKPDRVVYVSCDSATLARDLKILCEQDYKLEKFKVVDQFCHSVHVESVCLLYRIR